MSRWPSIQASARLNAQRQRLGQWLAEWRIEQDLLEPESAPGVCAQNPGGPAPCLPAPGQIALLYPASPPLAVRPRYYAILDQRSGGECLLAPFSRFSVPAVPGELDLGGPALQARVLCLWNARWCQPGQIPAAWPAGALTENERAEALALARSLMENAPPPHFLEERIGPPLQHPLDPRQEYLEEEKAWAACLPGISIRDTGAGGLYHQNSRSTHLPLAAEDRAKYHPSKDTPPDKN